MFEILYALSFLCTISSEPDCIFEAWCTHTRNSGYSQSVTGRKACNIVCCTRQSYNHGSIGRLTVVCWNWKLFSIKYLLEYHRILKIIGLPVRMPPFIISSICFWNICFSTETKCEGLYSYQMEKVFLILFNIIKFKCKKHESIGKFTENVNLDLIVFWPLCLHGFPESRSFSVPGEVRIP